MIQQNYNFINCSWQVSLQTNQRNKTVSLWWAHKTNKLVGQQNKLNCCFPTNTRKLNVCYLANLCRKETNTAGKTFERSLEGLAKITTDKVKWIQSASTRRRNTHKHCFHSFVSRLKKSSHRQRNRLQQRCLLLRDVVISRCAGVINSSPCLPNVTLREHCVCMRFYMIPLNSVPSFVFMSKL